VSRIQRIAPVAAVINAVVAFLTLFLAVALIGPAAMADRKLLMELALHSPAPLIAQDFLKFAAAGAALVLIATLHMRLATANPKLIRVATAFGLLSVAFLLANATLSLAAISRAAEWAQAQPNPGTRMSAITAGLGLGAILMNAPWYLFVNWSALKSQKLPKSLCYLGLTMGALSFVPILGIIVLVLSSVWSAGLGVVLRKYPING